MELDIDLNDVKEKPLLPADQEMTLMIILAQLKIAKNPNAKTGQKEPYIGCEIVPLDPQYVGQDYKIYHNFGLTPGALSSPDPTFSIKKFFTVVGHEWSPTGKFTTEEVQTIKFIGKLKYDQARPNFAQLGAVLRGAS